METVNKSALYRRGKAAMDAGDLRAARAAFYKVGDYKDAKELYKRIFAACQKEVCVCDDGSQSITEYTYDGRGNLLKKICKYPYDIMLTTVESFVYDEQDRKIKTCLRDNFDHEGEYEYTYGENGDLIKSISNTPTVQSVTEYLYDKSGKRIKEVETYHDGASCCTEYTYDKSGKRIKKVYTRPNGDHAVTEYTYDERGNLKKEVDTRYNDGKISIEYTYDEFDNPLTEKWTIFNEPDGGISAEYAYDDFGLLIKKTETFSGGTTVTTVYSDFLCFAAK